ncbi:hypothetical protein FEZ18_08190 [Oceanihabitans sp. IOP_32]|uniref:hypothetical protein n=1 Tax=Oceanihabitans sp. IOP_32 TaxID=2529032 RepID=UPI0012933A37|nr:hypothetical protein [Oceanihabitans sp. IOP_32]QFZ54778.1 hypothetical protein FEZ18_08190 [Oceanihabitans sp. IOP_32]
MKKSIKNSAKYFLAVFALISLTMSCSPEDGIDGKDGKDGIDGIDGKDGKDGVPTYYNPITITDMNVGRVDVSTTNTDLNIGTKTFTKIDENTQIDIKFRANIKSGTFSKTPAAIKFELFVNGGRGNASSVYWIQTSNTTEFVILDSVFSYLPIGTHTITISARMNHDTSTGVFVDPGNLGGKIIVQER